jgi:UDP-hydrolysing UDP-N-acetyl-D-glucosamine 2-epimerase
MGFGGDPLTGGLWSGRPDIVVTIADRHETLAAAIAASYMNIPLVHVQGGETSGSIDDKVRNAVTQLADYHFVSTKEAAKRVNRLLGGLNEASIPDVLIRGYLGPDIHVTGCPSIDLAKHVLEATNWTEASDVMARVSRGYSSEEEIALGFDPFKKYPGSGTVFDLSRGYVVVLFHPNTREYDDAYAQTEELIKAVWQIGSPAFWFLPNIDAGSDAVSKAIRVARNENRIAGVHFQTNMEPEDFLKLLVNSHCLIGNSSVGIRECSYLGVPVVNIGTRQQGRERGPNVKDVGYNAEEIYKAFQNTGGQGMKWPPRDLYGDGKSGERIANLLAEIEI